MRRKPSPSRLSKGLGRASRDADRVIRISKLEADILLHALNAPDALFAEDEVADLEQFQIRCESMAEAASRGEIELRDELDVEILARAAEENTFVACIEGGPPMQLARAVKAAYSLQQKISSALGRDVVIPCG